ncbi:MAG: methyltransferase domain-containing protein [Thermoanaerobaculia bacterium]
MTGYELVRLSAWPILPVLHWRVRRDLRALMKGAQRYPVDVLDVGGRKSPYTIGLPAKVTILDLPREHEVQKQLDLGISDGVLRFIHRRRSNVVRVVLEDMTRCSLESAAYAGVVSVEVIEHVENDEAFVAQVARILKPGGWFYLTTPNGDYVKNEPPNYNPDHRRHYTRAGLQALLARHFADVRVVYGVKTGKNRARGLSSFNPRRPIRTARAFIGNVLSHAESVALDEQSRRTAHLFATAWKASGTERG